MGRNHGRISIAARAFMLVALTGALWVPAANAAFPGRDGAILFSNCRDDESCQIVDLFLMEADGSDIRPFGTYGAWGIDWHPDGSKVLLSGGEFGGIDVVQQNGTGRHRIVPADECVWSGNARWSPSGRQIAFERVRTCPEHAPVTQGIYIMNADGTHARVLFAGPYTDIAWSPDGKQLAFTAGGWIEGGANGGTWSERTDIYIGAADGSSVRNITDDEAADSTPSWSPDGQRIAYSSAPADSTGMVGDIWSISPAGVGRRRLAAVTGREYDPDWSPSGSRILYMAHNGVRTDVWVMNADGSDRRNLTAGGATSSLSPDWQTLPEDRIAPETWVNEPRSGPVEGRDVTFVFTSSEPSDTIECRLDGGKWSSCHAPKVQGMSTKTYRGLSNGSHLFEARATDAAGNVDLTPAQKTVIVDAATPVSSDADGDGTPNSSDACPNEPAATADGCPGPPSDSDGDGVADFYDGCPGVVGVATNRGCPATTPAATGGTPRPLGSPSPPPEPVTGTTALPPRHLSARARRLAGRRLRVSGRLIPPPGVPAAACRGRVRVMVQSGRTRVAGAPARIRPGCTYRVVLRLPSGRRARGVLKVKTRFLGNDTLAPRNGATVRVRVR